MLVALTEIVCEPSLIYEPGGFRFFHPNDLTEVLWEFTFAAIP